MKNLFTSIIKESLSTPKLERVIVPIADELGGGINETIRYTTADLGGLRVVAMRNYDSNMGIQYLATISPFGNKDYELARTTGRKARRAFIASCRKRDEILGSGRDEK